MALKKLNNFAAVVATTEGITLPAIAQGANYTLPLSSVVEHLADIEEGTFEILSEADYVALPVKDENKVYILHSVDAVVKVDPTPAAKFRDVGAFAIETTYKNGDIVTLGDRKWIYAGSANTTTSPSIENSWVPFGQDPATVPTTPAPAKGTKYRLTVSRVMSPSAGLVLPTIRFRDRSGQPISFEGVQVTGSPPRAASFPPANAIDDLSDMTRFETAAPLQGSVFIEVTFPAAVDAGSLDIYIGMQPPGAPADFTISVDGQVKATFTGVYWSGKQTKNFAFG